MSTVPLRWILSLFVVCSCCIHLCTSVVRFDLTGRSWILKQSANASASELPAVVPGDVYLDLFRAKQVPDPYYRDNDIQLRWISKTNWTYSRQFDVPDQISKLKQITLTAHGIDTIATVYLNGQILGTTKNMFHSYSWKLSPSYLRSNVSNTLRFDFWSPVEISDKLSKEHFAKYKYNVPPPCTPAVQHGECHANFLRKMQASFSWDWGPAFPTMGIWKDIYIEGHGLCRMTGVAALPTKPTSDKWKLNIEAYLQCEEAVEEADFIATIDEASIKEQSSVKLVKGDQTVSISITVPADKVEMWWPNGLGGQKMYTVNVRITTSDDTIKGSVEFGFRTIKLIQDPVKPQGLTFYFKVNDVPVFLKGSNWIPGDAFQSRLTCDRLAFTFESLRASHSNAIRVWGGGVYESDCFYRLADEHGVLIWQDFMFAVALYPGTDEFLESVGNETLYQVRRLKSHPSILIWAGNNENEQGITGGWYAMDTDRETYYRDYRALYNATIRRIVHAEDITRPYVASSPSNGIESEKAGDIAGDPNSDYFGDKHHYNYQSDGWVPGNFPIPRCVTEYGFASLPSMESLENVLEPEDLDYFGSQLNLRQHHTGGVPELPSQVLMHFKLPDCAAKQNNWLWTSSQRDLCGEKSNLSKEHFLETIVYLSQAYQAMSIKTETELYRRMRTQLDGSGRGLTMCALYWQLNDIWDAPTWASLEYSGKWKMLHYFAKRFYAPIFVSPFVDQQKLVVTVVSDVTNAEESAQLIVEAFAIGSFKSIYNETINIAKVAPLASENIYQKMTTEIVGSNSLSIINVRLVKGDRDLSPNGVVLPLNLYEVPTNRFGNVTIVSVIQSDTKVFDIELLSDGPALFTWLDAYGLKGYFSDNGFTTVQPKTKVQFHAWYEVSLHEFYQKLTVYTLADLYKPGYSLRTKGESNKNNLASNLYPGTFA